MGTQPVERRLAAIVAADVVGYSRLMEANEEATLDALLRHRSEFLEPTIERHGGRLFKVMGDGFLIEFASVLNAVRCAIAIQRGMPDRNAGQPEDRHFHFRIGINLGDIIIDKDDVYGDGVNIAVRVQGLAKAGSIACTGAVRDATHSKLDCVFADQGLKRVKNLSHPIQVYQIRADMEGTHASTASLKATGRPNAIDKPSIAILPFTNLSADPGEEYFSNGITEDIITDLSNVSGLFVISRNTVYAYKRKSQNLERAASELGVSYIVEGSVRRQGDRVRINAELIDGTTDTHLWAARFDRELTDIFEVQDEIAKTIVAQLKVRLRPEEQQAIELEPTESVEAYTHYLRGREYYHIASKANHLMARHCFLRAIELDPNYARAYAGIAVCDVRLKSSYGADIPVDDIVKSADRALAIDPSLSEAHAAKAFALSLGSDRSDAIPVFETALRMDPDCHEANRYFAEFAVTAGDFESAARHFARALEIKPTDYGAAVMLVNVYRSLGDLDKASAYARLSVRKTEEEMARHPGNANCACLAATVLAFLGEREKSMQWLARSLDIDPGDTNIQYNAACTYAILGEADHAVALLKSWIDRVGDEMRLWFRNDSDFDGIRDHPEFQALLGRASG